MQNNRFGIKVQYLFSFNLEITAEIYLMSKIRIATASGYNFHDYFNL